MSVSVVIPNYNGEKYIRGCLDSLLKQSLKADEIIIVDNNSSDNSLEIIQEYKDYIKLICLKQNHGFSVAVNEGIKASNTEFVTLLNNDTELEENWLEELVKCISIEKRIFSCCSKMIRYDNKEVIDDAGDEYTLLGWARKIGDGKNISQYTEKREVFSSCAGAAIYRKSILDEIGYFDENFFAYLEDMDISYRAKIYGYINYYCPSAKVYHIGSATSGSKHNDFKVKLASRNNIFLIYKNMPNLQIILNLIFIILGIIVKGIYFSLKGLGKAYFKGLYEGIINRGKVKRIKVYNNFRNYKRIEIELIKNTMNLFKRG